MRIVLSFLLSIVSLSVFAQNLEKVLQNTDREKLQKLAEEFRAQYVEDSIRAAEYLNRTGEAKVFYGENGFMAELIGITENGDFIYNQTDNLQSAETISTDEVWSAAPNGYGVTGTGMDAAVWDGGRTRISHREFGTRGTQVDGSPNVSNHATHVSGTVAARGIRSGAKGMAPDVNLKAYDWGNDDNEMAGAAANGLLVSNHSYGTSTGWRRSGSTWRWMGNPNVSPTEDYRFGFYGIGASNWDQIAFAAPYYLICKSAGNDRNDGPNNAGQNGNPDRDPTYGSISSYSMAKNIMVVGAVEGISGGYLSPAQVNMTSFSCWGPTDDGRIRPHVVAKGRGVLSSWGSGDAAYNSIQGTSMAAPAVTGSAILLQQHYENVNGSGNFMRSATLKGLIIHTADEAGTFDGPDYRHGWGLMNTKKAADLISDTNAYILERSLSSGQNHRIKVVVDQQRDVKLTLAWTDPAHNALPASLNPTTSVLINDLDIRFRQEGSSTDFKPWVLNPANPSSAATRGDNFRDNEEKIELPNLAPGVYFIEISHKGSTLLNGSQAYSLIAEGVGILPQVNFSVQDTSLCLGESTQLSGITSSDVTSYRWKSSNPNIQFTNPNSRITQVTGSQPGAYDVWLVVENGRGKDSASVTGAFRVNQNLNVEIDSTSVFCLPDNSVQSFGASIPGGSWNGGFWMPFTDTVLFVPSTVGAGDYEISYLVTDDNGCKGYDTTTIIIREGPEAQLDSVESFCNTAADISLSGGFPAGGVYQVNGNIDSLIRPSVIGAGIHRVSYTVTDTNNCEASAERIFEIRNCLGIDEQNAELSIYPNPFKESLNIQSQETIGLLEIKDMLGKTIKRQNIQSSKARIELTEFESGIYFIQHKSSTFKILKTQ